MILDFINTRAELGQRNRRLVLAEILFKSPIPRAKIAERVGLTPASVSRISRELLDAGLIEEGEEVALKNHRGRRFVGLRMKPSGCYVAGFALNAFRQDIVVADLTNTPLACHKIHFTDLSVPETVLAESAEQLNALIEETGIDRERLISCGIAVTGAVDPVACVLRSAPTLGWKDVEVGDIFRKRLGLPVFMENIPNAKNLAAHGFGPTKDVSNVVLINASLGIGCSLLVDGRLVRGHEFNTGLLENLLIPQEDSSALCHLDEAAGGYAVIEYLRSNGKTVESSPSSALIKIIEQAAHNEDTAVKALRRAGRALAFAISAANAFLNPETLLLSGPLVESPTYCNSVRERLTELVDEQFVQDKLCVIPMSSHDAAQSLAIYQALVKGRVGSVIPNSQLEV